MESRLLRSFLRRAMFDSVKLSRIKRQCPQQSHLMAKSKTQTAAKSATQKKPNPAGEFLELFFPIHYTIGMAVEDSLRNGVLTRQQTIILWLIRSKGEDGGKWMRRKDIVKSMSSWFDLTNSAISKALRSIAKPPYNLISIQEDPDSGREKVVKVTAKGQKFINQMIGNAENLIEMFTEELSDQEISEGVRFFKRLSDIFDEEIADKRSSLNIDSKPSVNPRA